MTAFTTTISTTTSLDNSLVDLFSSLAYFPAQAEAIVPQFARVVSINGKSEQFSKYNDITPSTSALTQDEDVTSDEFTDGYLTLTPAEYGQVITRSALVQFQSGGKVDSAAATAVGRLIGQVDDKLAIAALAAASPIGTVYPNSVSAEASLSSTDTAGREFVAKMYNKLARRNTPVHPLTGSYIAVAHGDIISDIMAEAGEGAWEDVSKYQMGDSVLRNAIGYYGGFIWVRDANSTVTADGGAGSVDSYTAYGFGDNVLMKGVGVEPGITITGPFDKLARFLNIGYKGIWTYGVLDGNNLVFGKCASSFGSNS